MASPNIAFDTIPGSPRKPLAYAEFNTRMSRRGLPGNPQRLVILAAMLAAGSAVANMPLPVFSDTEAGAGAGYGSVAHLMVRAALIANPYAQIVLVPVPDAPASAAAVGSVALAGTPSATGLVSLLIHGVRVDALASPADTPTTLAAALAATIGNLPDLALTATAAAGTLTLTAKNKGSVGNGIPLRAVVTAPGITATVTAMASGTGDPDITAALTGIFTAGYQIYASAFADAGNLARLRDHLDSVSNAVEIRGAHGWCGSVGSMATAISTSAALNAGRVGCAALRNSPSAPWQIAAAMAAVDAFEEDPARPLNTLPLMGILPPGVGDRFSRTEQETLLYNGVTPLETGPGDKVQIVRAISTYTVSALGAPDEALLDITTIKTLDYFRMTVVNDQKIRFAREKITDRTLAAIPERVYVIALQLQELEMLRNVETWKAGFFAELDGQSATRVNLRVPAPVVPGLHILASRFDLIL